MTHTRKKEGSPSYSKCVDLALMVYIYSECVAPVLFFWLAVDTNSVTISDCEQLKIVANRLTDDFMYKFGNYLNYLHSLKQLPTRTHVTQKISQFNFF